MSVGVHPDEFYLRNTKYDGQLRFSTVIAHECHHIKREQEGPGYGTALGEMLVSEGLAQKFELETGHPSFLNNYLSPAATQRMSENARTILDCPMGADGAFNNSDGKPVDIDRYYLGLALIKGWSNYTGQTAASSYGVPASAILDPWKNGEYDIVELFPTPAEAAPQVHAQGIAPHPSPLTRFQCTPEIPAPDHL
jgi:uncharacterized protein YjaZ